VAVEPNSDGKGCGVTFGRFTEAQWQAICSTRSNWPKGINWRGEIEAIGRDYWDARAARETWVKKLQGKKPSTQREKIYKAWISTQQSQKALAGLMADGLLDEDFPHPDLESPEYRLKTWLSDYDVWVRPFAGKSNPIQAELEWRLMDLWKRSGGKLRWSRKKDDAGTPYAPLVDFLMLTLNSILGRALKPSGVAKMIDRHRGQRSKHDPFLMYAMHFRIT
jgi:hypothetical protein